MNVVVEAGRLANKPEIAYTPQTNTAKCMFDIAVERKFKKEGQPDCDFLRIVVWGAKGENCYKYLTKGQEVIVHGSIRTGSYTNKEGRKVNTWEILADDVQFGAKPKNQQADEEVSEPVSPPIAFAQVDEYIPY